MKSAREPLVWAEVDLDALRHNLRAIRSATHAQVLAVVKADAYGHGMKAVARALAREGVKFFGVANLDEALELRRVCPKAKILVLGSFHPAQVALYARHAILPTVSSVEDAVNLSRGLRKRPEPFPVHVKIDTGMGRLGVWHEDAVRFFEAIRKEKALCVDGLYTHLSSADRPDPSFTEAQLALYERAVERALAAGLRPTYFHAANSLGLMRFRKSHLNLVRPGIVLYGINPSAARPPLGLRPVLSLRTRISFLKDVEKGRTVSYGATYRAPKKTRIATLAVGYSHGYRVGFSSRAFVSVRGKRCPVVGRVTMDQTLVDVGRVPAARRWDAVTLIGRDGKSEITARELADLSGTIPYEIVCSIHTRIPRIYKELR
ncbi:MAG TPA: alanine racemase [Candidatus Eisenbacteria bacterium]|nr:alanine racemase [Candidatus Eisenbacteria bacterium]